MTKKERQKTAFTSTIVSIILNTFLFTSKFLCGKISGSAAITADAFNNLSDAGTCAAELFGFGVAGIEGGEKHPFGHGRVEWLMGFISSIFVILMGYEMIRNSFQALRTPATVEMNVFSLVVLGVSILVKGCMFLYNRKLGTKIDSVAMKAKAYDSLGDLASTSVVLLSMIVGSVTGWQVDGWCGIAVSIFILYAGIKALTESVNPLLGESPDTDIKKEIEEIAGKYHAVVGIYDLMIHDYGFHRLYISFHVGMDNRRSHEEMVNSVSELWNELREKFGENISIQIEPVSAEAGQLHELRQLILESAGQTIAGVQIEHLRILQSDRRTQVILELWIPVQLRSEEIAVKKNIEETVYGWSREAELIIHIKMGAHKKWSKKEKGLEAIS